MPVYRHRSLRDIAQDYALPGAVMLVLAWAATGCRFGNRVEYHPVQDIGNGFYETEPQTYNLCVTTTGASQCALQPTNLIPRSVTNVMTPLVLFQRESATSKNADIYTMYARTTSDPHFPFTYDSATGDLTLLAEPQSEPVSDTCTDKFNVEAKGKLARTEKRDVTIGNETVSVSGRVNMDFRITESFIGACAEVMELLYECYIENASCPADLQTMAKSTFQPYIDAGLITPEDIPEVTDIGYEIGYK